MKMSKIFAGMSALAMAAAVAAPVSADEAPAENQFYNATGTWTMTYNGSDIANENIWEKVDPAEGETAPEDVKAQLVGYTNAETGNVDTYNFGCSIQVGHMKKAKVTVRVTSSTNNIWDGENAVSEGYMYTVQTSWSGDTPADFQDGWIKYQYNEDGSQKMGKGACDLVDWNSGSTKFNGQWAQITLTDNDLSALTFEITVTADDKTTWEYHPYSADKEDEYKYTILNFGGYGCFTPASVVGDGDCHAAVGTSEDGIATNTVVVDGDYINSQFGGVTRPSADSSSEGGDDSNSQGGGNGSKSDSNSNKSSSSSKSGGGSNGGSNKSGGGSKTTTKTTTSTSTAGEGEAASDNTENAKSGAASSIALAFAAIAGAAMVVSRKK